MGILDLLNGYDDTANFLGQQDRLSDDLIALEQASEAWQGDVPVRVGESGTLYRFLSFVSWKFCLDKEFIIDGTLLNRSITRNPAIVNLPQRELLQLDHQTSQWASAAALCGDPERLANPPNKLRLSYKAIEHWNEQRAQEHSWLPRHDITIARQAAVFQALNRGESAQFEPAQAEDYCFAVVLDYITPEEGAARWPNLAGHESNRALEMAVMMERARLGQSISSHDHRVVQAVAMWGRLADHEVTFEHPEAVNKSWSEFWNFLSETPQ